MKKFLKENCGLLITIFIAIVIFCVQEIRSKAETNRLIESFKKDMKEFASGVLKTTKIPETIDARTKKELSDSDKRIASQVAQKVDKIDERFKELMGDPSDYLKLGNAEYYGKNYKKAIEYYDKAIKLNPDYAKAWSNKGVALVNLGDYEEALKSYDKVIELNPDFAWVWDNKGNALIKLNRYEEALKSYEKATELNPDDAQVWSNKGVTLRRLGRNEEALKAYDKAIKIDPNRAFLWYLKVCVLQKLGRDEEADKAHKKAKELGYK